MLRESMQIIEMVFHKDVRGKKLIEEIATSTSADHDSKWLTRLQKLIGMLRIFHRRSSRYMIRFVDIETLKLFDALYVDCPLEVGKETSRKDREEKNLLHEKVLACITMMTYDHVSIYE
jgi:hypothetical protein